jgi:hypothetical protein
MGINNAILQLLEEQRLAEQAPDRTAPIVEPEGSFRDNSPPPTIEQMYQTVLGRAPDEGGLAYWKQQFGDTVDPNELATFKQAAAPEISTVQQNADKWFAEHPNANPQMVADTIKSNGGLTPELAKVLADHYGVDASAIEHDYKQLIAPVSSASVAPVNPQFTSADYGPPKPADYVAPGSGVPVSRLSDMPGAEPVPMYEDTGGGGINATVRRLVNQVNSGQVRGGGGGSNQGPNNLINMGAGAVASRYIPYYDYLSGVNNLINGNYGSATKDLISGLTGGLSSVFGFANGGPAVNSIGGLNSVSKRTKIGGM